jgi:hypothetical protein
MLCGFWLVLFSMPGPWPSLAQLFQQGDSRAFEKLLDSAQVVEVGLRPLLQDQGRLSPGQTSLCFRSFLERYEVLAARDRELLSDANYALFEAAVELELRERETGRRYSALAVFQFKTREKNRVLTRWHFQDLR